MTPEQLNLLTTALREVEEAHGHYKASVTYDAPAALQTAAMRIYVQAKERYSELVRQFS